MLYDILEDVPMENAAERKGKEDIGKCVMTRKTNSPDSVTDG